METNSKIFEVVESELVISRILDAPRELVWKAWTEPELIQAWWGPKDYTVPVCKNTLKVGGDYLFCMRSPDGKDFWSTGKYIELIKPSKIVMTDSFADENGNIVHASYYGMEGEWPLELMITVTLEDADQKTRFILKHHGMPQEDMSDIAEEGWNESLDKLENALETLKVLNSKTSSSEIPIQTTTTLNPYLNFPGNTEEAFTFYKSVFGGDFVSLMRFKETPDGERFPPDVQDKIMHVALPIGKGNMLMGTDSIESMGQKLTPGNNIHLTLGAASRNEADRLFSLLSEGGTIEMAMNVTFWGSYFGMCRDKFGIQWMISYNETLAK